MAQKIRFRLFEDFEKKIIGNYNIGKIFEKVVCCALLSQKNGFVLFTKSETFPSCANIQWLRRFASGFL